MSSFAFPIYIYIFDWESHVPQGLGNYKSRSHLPKGLEGVAKQAAQKEAADSRKKKKAEVAHRKHKKEKEVARRVKAERGRATSMPSLSWRTPRMWTTWFSLRWREVGRSL